MKRPLLVLLFSVILFSLTISGCKTPQLEPGGVYAPTNSVGEVVRKDTALFASDAAHKFAFESIQAVFKFERDNRAELRAISPNIKKELDKLRIQAAMIEKRWAAARQAYRANPTPEGLEGVNLIIAELSRIVPIVQAQITTSTTPTN